MPTCSNSLSGLSSGLNSDVSSSQPAVSFAAATIAFGGLARLRSWQQRGRPHPITVGAIALETIGVPILLAWQRRLSAKAV